MMDLCVKVAHDTPVPPTTVNPDIPAVLEAIVLRCLAKEPARRWPDAARLAAALEAFRLGKDVAGADAVEPEFAMRATAPSLPDTGELGATPTLPAWAASGPQTPPVVRVSESELDMARSSETQSPWSTRARGPSRPARRTRSIVLAVATVAAAGVVAAVMLSRPSPPAAVSTPASAGASPSSVPAVPALPIEGTTPAAPSTQAPAMAPPAPAPTVTSSPAPASPPRPGSRLSPRVAASTRPSPPGAPAPPRPASADPFADPN
jgi:serine/threonine-protein kinase